MYKVARTKIGLISSMNNVAHFHRPVILLLGANGQVGWELRRSLSLLGTVIALDRNGDNNGNYAGNLEDPCAIEATIQTLKPQVVVNAAAYTAVDKAEHDYDKAYLINALAVAQIAKACKEVNALLVHYSTDYVFDGESETPYKEDDATGPINTYGKSKLLGEQLCMKEDADAIIIRTSWVYSSFGHNFVKTMMRLMNERNELNVVSDQIGSPTYAADLAKAILDIISSSEWESGIYHYSNEGKISWFEFAQAIKELTGSKAVVHPILTAEYPTPARRPKFSLMNKDKIRTVYQLEIPVWKDSLAKCIQLLQSAH